VGAGWGVSGCPWGVDGMVCSFWGFWWFYVAFDYTGKCD